MKVAISQPSYLGWVGFFALIDAADVFVLLDTVDIARQSWQTRSRIRVADGRLQWLSVPVHSSKGQCLAEVRISYERSWQERQWQTISEAYAHALHRDALDPLKAAYLFSAPILLTTLTCGLIRQVCVGLGITTTLVNASDLAPTRTDRDGRLEDLLEQTNADVYLSSRGSTYLADRTRVGRASLQWFDYTEAPYEQGLLPWQDHLSIIDLLAHTGSEALSVIRQGYAATV